MAQPQWLAHAALHVLRVNLLPRYVHLFRFMPVDRSLQLARSVDDRVLPWLQEQLDLPLSDPAVRILLQTPCAHGGLSLLRLHHEALLHCISGLLALPVSKERRVRFGECGYAIGILPFQNRVFCLGFVVLNQSRCW